MSETKTELSFGQKAVGLDFNPSALTEVNEIKAMFATSIDRINEWRNKTDNPDKKRYFSLAITHAEEACSRTVKALTWKY